MYTILITKGSDLTFDVIFKELDGTPANLTGEVIDLYDIHPKLQGHITTAVDAPTDGTVTVAMTWQEDMPMGNVMSFRLRRTDEDNFKQTTYEFRIEVA